MENGQWGQATTWGHLGDFILVAGRCLKQLEALFESDVSYIFKLDLMCLYQNHQSFYCVAVALCYTSWNSPADSEFATVHPPSCGFVVETQPDPAPFWQSWSFQAD